MQGVLSLAVELWTFRSPRGLQISNFSKCWASPPHLAKVGLRQEIRSQLGGQWKVLMFGGPWKVPCLAAFGRSIAWWPFKGSMLGGLWKVPLFGGQWKEKEKHLFPSSHFPPNKFYLNYHFFHWYQGFILYYGSRPLLMHFLLFLWSINYNPASWCNKSFTHSLLIWFWLKISLIFLDILASRMATSYRPQVAQVNEKSAPETSLDLTLTQHPCDEDRKPWEMHVFFEVEPPRA